MRRILNAIAEILEAKAELIREEAATTGLRTYSRAFKEGQDDLLSGAEVVYTTESGDDE
ncbi:hypothetical protein ACFC25_04315 [Pseudarthrobacter sp. NPDC055928]|jgi:hypothetical protein|uniref:hypothetical protein n=1 Tax=Pseudarthrobacter sp. NPDC055928 TaxID=3345661 RepID=UPI0035E17FF6